MDVHDPRSTHKTTVGLLDSDPGGLVEARQALSALAPSVSVVIAVTSWGELLTDAAFPPDIVVLRPRADDRISVAYEARVCRIVDAGVLAVVDAEGTDGPTARDMSSLQVAVSLGEAAAVLEGWSVPTR